MTNTSVKLAIVCVAVEPGCTVVAPAPTAAALENIPTGSAKSLEGETMYSGHRPTTSKPTQSDRATPSPALTDGMITCVLRWDNIRHYGWTRGFGEHHCIKWAGRGPYRELNPRSWWRMEPGYTGDDWQWFDEPGDIMTVKKLKTAQEAAHEKSDDVLAA